MGDNDNDNLDAGLLLAFNLSDSDDVKEDRDAGGNSGRAGKTAQSEAAFRAVQASYPRPKIENGEAGPPPPLPVLVSSHRAHKRSSAPPPQIWKTIKLPLTAPLHKLDAQEILHAVEELYFLARYDEAVRFANEVLDGRGDANALDRETVELLRVYEAKCLKKMGRVQPRTAGFRRESARARCRRRVNCIRSMSVGVWIASLCLVRRLWAVWRALRPPTSKMGVYIPELQSLSRPPLYTFESKIDIKNRQVPTPGPASHFV